MKIVARTLAVFVCLFTAHQVFTVPLVYDESVDGDLPDALLALDIGANTVAGRNHFC